VGSEDIVKRKPVDKTAALVTGKGVHYEREVKSEYSISDLPIPTRLVERNNDGNPEFEDLTGRRAGRMVCIGLARDYNGRWVVKCDCGRYTTRSTKSIKKAAPDNMCEHCQRIVNVKRYQEYKRLGYNTDVHSEARQSHSILVQHNEQQPPTEETPQKTRER
jgi:hypothetical protein